MHIDTGLPRPLSLLATTLAIAASICGCSKDPLSTAYSAQPPASLDLAGTYVPDPGSITTVLAQAGTGGSPVIKLTMDGRITITGMQDLGLKELDGKNVKGDGLQSTWSLGRNDESWMILADAVEIFVVRDKPPFGLEVKVGQPGRERILRFERQSPAK